VKADCTDQPQREERRNLGKRTKSKKRALSQAQRARGRNLEGGGGEKETQKKGGGFKIGGMEGGGVSLKDQKINTKEKAKGHEQGKCGGGGVKRKRSSRGGLKRGGTGEKRNPREARPLWRVYLKEYPRSVLWGGGKGVEYKEHNKKITRGGKTGPGGSRVLGGLYRTGGGEKKGVKRGEG